MYCTNIHPTSYGASTQAHRKLVLKHLLYVESLWISIRILEWSIQRRIFCYPAAWYHKTNADYSNMTIACIWSFVDLSG